MKCFLCLSINNVNLKSKICKKCIAFYSYWTNPARKTYLQCDNNNNMCPESDHKCKYCKLQRIKKQYEKIGLNFSKNQSNHKNSTSSVEEIQIDDESNQQKESSTIEKEKMEEVENIHPSNLSQKASYDVNDILFICHPDGNYYPARVESILSTKSKSYEKRSTLLKNSNFNHNYVDPKQINYFYEFSFLNKLFENEKQQIDLNDHKYLIPIDLIRKNDTLLVYDQTDKKWSNAIFIKSKIDSFTVKLDQTNREKAFKLENLGLLKKSIETFLKRLDNNTHQEKDNNSKNESSIDSNDNKSPSSSSSSSPKTCSLSPIFKSKKKKLDQFLYETESQKTNTKNNDKYQYERESDTYIEEPFNQEPIEVEEEQINKEQDEVEKLELDNESYTSSPQLTTRVEKMNKVVIYTTIREYEEIFDKNTRKTVKRIISEKNFEKIVSEQTEIITKNENSKITLIQNIEHNENNEKNKKVPILVDEKPNLYKKRKLDDTSILNDNNKISVDEFQTNKAHKSSPKEKKNLLNESLTSHSSQTSDLVIIKSPIGNSSKHKKISSSISSSSLLSDGDQSLAANKTSPTRPKRTTCNYNNSSYNPDLFENYHKLDDNSLDSTEINEKVESTSNKKESTSPIRLSSDLEIPSNSIQSNFGQKQLSKSFSKAVLPKKNSSNNNSFSSVSSNSPSKTKSQKNAQHHPKLLLIKSNSMFKLPSAKKNKEKFLDATKCKKFDIKLRKIDDIHPSLKYNPSIKLEISRKQL